MRTFHLIVIKISSMREAARKYISPQVDDHLVRPGTPGHQVAMGRTKGPCGAVHK